MSDESDRQPYLDEFCVPHCPRCGGVIGPLTLRGGRCVVRFPPAETCHCKVTKGAP